jgi:polar amino acid transport system substrate-binding protein
MKRSIKTIIVLFILLSIVGYASTSDAVEAQGTKSEPLLVGVTPNYPPIIFKQGDNVVGVEADLARLLGKELKRPINFVELRWEQQIPALLEGKIDIIMSGMSVTTARKVRINFSNHYLKSGLVAAFRIEDAKKYDSFESMTNSYSTVGVVQGTTGDAFVNRNFTKAIKISHLSKADSGAYELKRRRLDLFVHDAPSIMWIVSENEADITALWKPLNEEYFAWGIGKDKGDLLFSVNNTLNKWKEDGTLDKVLIRWLPKKYLDRVGSTK